MSGPSYASRQTTARRGGRSSRLGPLDVPAQLNSQLSPKKVHPPFASTEQSNALVDYPHLLTNHYILRKTRKDFGVSAFRGIYKLPKRRYDFVNLCFRF